MTQLEHAPRGVMKEQASKARDEAGGLPLYYTEWNISSNPRDPLHDEPFAAAFITGYHGSARDSSRATVFGPSVTFSLRTIFPRSRFTAGSAS
jgi:hypothetical protein